MLNREQGEGKTKMPYNKEIKKVYKKYDGEKYGYICMTCGKTIKNGVNKDGECTACIKNAEKARELFFKK